MPNLAAKLALLASVLVSGDVHRSAEDDPPTIRIGLNYPETGTAAAEGLDQLRGAQLAVREINEAGGILGRKLELVRRDSRSQAKATLVNVTQLIDEEGCRMIFGGTSSTVASVAGRVCRSRGVPFFATLAYADAVTIEKGQRTGFRECYDTWSSTRALGAYLQENFARKEYFYLTVDQTWGHTTESALRRFTDTRDQSRHRGMLLDSPGSSEEEFKRAISFAKLVKPDVLVLVLFGDDVQKALRQAAHLGLAGKVQVVVPNLTLDVVDSAGAEVAQGVIGAVPWCWQVPYTDDHWRGRRFVERFVRAHDRYPGSSAGSAYTIVHQWKQAVERAGALEGAGVIAALEGHRYMGLKDEQLWRAFDHQSLQTVYVVRCRPRAEVEASRLGQDFFEIVARMKGPQAFRTREEWEAARIAVGKPPHLEELGEAVATKGSRRPAGQVR